MAKKSKSKIPKRLAGMKVPKTLRKAGIGALIASPIGAAIIAELIVHFTDGFSRKTKRGRKARKFVHHPLESMKHGTADLAHGALTNAITEAMKTFTDTLRDYRVARDVEYSESNDLAHRSGREDRTQAAH